MPLSIYNTLSRQKEEFKPIHEGHVGIYVCGPTVYSHSHIGHAKSYISFDIIVRYLRYLGNNVLYIQNITDVGHLTDDADEGEDKLIKQARIDRVHPMQIAESITRSYFDDMDKLGIERPDISPRASGHIIEQIEIIKKLLANGHAYEVNGSVYYNVQKFKNYGRLSGRVLEESVEGTRVETRSEKRHPADFALWKKAESGHIMRWPSPWSEGFPGWHIECSAMSMKYLGETFDIHGGGMDNQFPHHECEIAQSEAATGKPFVNYWVHNNLVTVNGKKMSKSLGNFVTLKDAFKKYDPIVVRFFILQSHYRSTLDFSDEAVQAANTGFDKLMNTIRNLREELMKAETEQRTSGSAFDCSPYRKHFLEAMDDDFNAPLAVGVLFDLARETNHALNSGQKLSLDALKQIDLLFSELGGTVLGIIPDQIGTAAGDTKTESRLMDLFINIRAEVRKQKLWTISDVIRDGLKAVGFIIEDKKEGTIWRKIQ
ncbi:MAG: cysteine--tRNA ligase [Ignavibacteriae bacterium]|nr:MAG: cysteine--tRNA ligase [Ignavibacteriota bacterium]